MNGEGVWLYAVADAAPVSDDLGAMTGVAGEPLRQVRVGALTAVVGSVPLAVFGAEPLRRNLEDLDWLDGVARTHDAVVSALSRRAPTVPMRLATVFLDDDRVRALLEERAADFESAIMLVAGRTEWGVKGYGDREALIAAVAAGDADRAGGGSGTAYLIRRRAQLSAQDTVEQEMAERVENIHEALVREAAAGRRQPATDPALSRTKEWMVLNGSYLVDDERSESFAAAVAALDENFPGIRLELTGPWPPYSFAGVGRDPA
ncbi:GvpL/GvpF family gas vesicle protein [Nocardia higoensis]|uniref:GvpL/GvpF family gas vesicle protein n=1 Tax=Nocardia higoensis TaxID=228599 RepID=A0ABS0DHD2_9NOCA|nr:GvpL/GvpF family gas vesicle protein [Nocardia higoensis]MBF6357829.1 GvpL/GvpF family gas vesicle protein [Nocardia higoensis]